MDTVLVPVRYPISGHSVTTLSQAIDIAAERDAELIVLHVSLYQLGNRVTVDDLKNDVQRTVGTVHNVRYLVRNGFLVEQGIVQEVADERADVVVIGNKHLSLWKRGLNWLRSKPDIGEYLERHVDCEIVVV